MYIYASIDTTRNIHMAVFVCTYNYIGTLKLLYSYLYAMSCIHVMCCKSCGVTNKYKVKMNPF